MTVIARYYDGVDEQARMDVVEVPEGISLQVANRDDESNYRSVLLDRDQVRELVHVLEGVA